MLMRKRDSERGRLRDDYDDQMEKVSSDTPETTDTLDDDELRPFNWTSEDNCDRDDRLQSQQTAPCTNQKISEKPPEASPEPLSRPSDHTPGPTRVSFGTVEIREHPITIGDNPGGYQGPPLTIEWKPQSQLKMKVEEFEASRPPRRNGAEMNIPAGVRMDMLREAGFSRGQVVAAMKPVNIARRQRKRTIEAMHLTSLQEFTERVRRGSLNLTVRRSSKKKERDYIKNALSVQKKMQEMVLEGSGSCVRSILSRDDSEYILGLDMPSEEIARGTRDVLLC